LSGNQALAPPPSAQQQAPLRAAIALPQTRSPLPANGVSPAMPNMGEHLPSSSPASHAAGSSSSASYSRELLGSAPQQQLEQAASRPSTASRPNLTSSPTSHNAPKFASGFLVPDRGQPRSKPSPAQSRPTSSRPAANAASDLPPGFASLAIGQAPNQRPAASDLPPGFASLAIGQLPTEAPNGMDRPAEPASSSVQTGDALSWAVAEQLVLPVPQKPVITIIPVAPVAGDSPWGDPRKAVKKNGTQPSASKVHTPAENVRCLDECLGHDCPMLCLPSCKTASPAASSTFFLPSFAFFVAFSCC